MKSSLMLKEPELSFDSLHQELNNFLRDTFMDNTLISPLISKKLSTWRPAIELKQNEKEYKIKVQLPGVSKEDINVDLENDFITISAEMHEEKKSDKDKDNNEKLHTSEFRYGKYCRTISFENPIKSKESTAEYKDGILNITVPKQKIEKAQTKRLTIK